MDGLHAFSTGLSALFSVFSFGFVIFVVYLIYIFRNKKYNNIVSFSIICLVLLPPVYGSIDDIARIIFKIIILIPIFLILVVLNIIINLIIRNKKSVGFLEYNKECSSLYKKYFLLVIVFNIVSIFSVVLYNINDNLYYSFHIIYNVYSQAILSTLLFYFIEKKNKGTIYKLILKISLLVIIFDIVNYILSYLLNSNYKNDIAYISFMIISFLKTLFTGIIFVENIEIKDSFVFKIFKSNFSIKVVIVLIYVVINYLFIMSNFSLMLDSLF